MVIMMMVMAMMRMATMKRMMDGDEEGKRRVESWSKP